MHQRLNLTCLTWQLHGQGRPWESAARKAEQLKADREQQWQREQEAKVEAAARRSRKRKHSAAAHGGSARPKTPPRERREGRGRRREGHRRRKEEENPAKRESRLPPSSGGHRTCCGGGDCPCRTGRAPCDSHSAGRIDAAGHSEWTELGANGTGAGTCGCHRVAGAGLDGFAFSSGYPTLRGTPTASGSAKKGVTAR